MRCQKAVTRYKTRSVIYRSEDRWRMPGSPNVSCSHARSREGPDLYVRCLTGPTGAGCRNSDAGSHATSRLESEVISRNPDFDMRPVG